MREVLPSLCALCCLFLACGEGAGSSATDVATAEPFFVERAAAAGLDFVHRNGAVGEFNYPEIVQGGVAFLDYDNDSWLDVYLVQSGPVPPQTDPDSPGNQLFRNLGDGSFANTTALAGVGDRGYGSGVAVADFDRDGWVDLYVTNLGPNRLYRNNGDGSFSDVTEAAGVADPGYSTSAAFVDFDSDGDLDLYVCNYVVWSRQLQKPCYGPNGQLGYCRPSEFEPQPDTLYRNEGDGRFSDVSESSGIRRSVGAGLGIVTADFDDDGRVDIYVTNDQMANHLWLNNGDGTFREEALLRGVALNELGQPEAGMGVATGDPDGDGDWDLFMVHLTGETNTYYRNDGGGFRDTTEELGLGAVSLPYTGFGTALFDQDNDGILDIFIANGKVSPGDTLELDFREPNQLLRGLPDGSYVDVSDAAGLSRMPEGVSRGSAFGDYDNDGDIDILVVDNGGPVRLLRNELGNRRHWLTVELDGGKRFGRNALGTVVTLETAAGRQKRQSQPAWSYCASNDPRLHFGLGDVTTIDRLVVTWPDHSTEELSGVDADQILRVAFAAETRAR